MFKVNHMWTSQNTEVTSSKLIFKFKWKGGSFQFHSTQKRNEARSANIRERKPRLPWKYTTEHAYTWLRIKPQSCQSFDSSTNKWREPLKILFISHVEPEGMNLQMERAANTGNHITGNKKGKLIHEYDIINHSVTVLLCSLRHIRHIVCHALPTDTTKNDSKYPP